jgi:hypothetical protein
MDVKLLFSMNREVMDSLRSAAEKMGISPSLFVRMLIFEKFSKGNSELKAYTFRTRNWREIEAYIKVRNLGSFEGFAPLALDLAMTRNRLSAKQKAEFDKLLSE